MLLAWPGFRLKDRFAETAKRTSWFETMWFQHTVFRPAERVKLRDLVTRGIGMFLHWPDLADDKGILANNRQEWRGVLPFQGACSYFFRGVCCFRARLSGSEHLPSDVLAYLP